MRYKILIASVAVLPLAFSCQPENVVNGEVAETVQTMETRSPTPSPIPKQLTAEEKEEKTLTEERMLKGEYHHDGSGVLARLGDLDSVPSLLAVLRKNPPLPGGAMVCTRGHALNALYKITGAKPGIGTEDWEKWWDDRKKAK